MTGGYCVNGGGMLQLTVTQRIMSRLGCKIWDLGMNMTYKCEQVGGFCVDR